MQILDNATRLNPDPSNPDAANKSDSSRATTPTTLSSTKLIKPAAPAKTYSANLKPIMKYVLKNGVLVDSMSDQTGQTEKDIEKRIG